MAESVAFTWDVVENHPDHLQIRQLVCEALEHVRGRWIVAVSPATGGWQVRLRSGLSEVAAAWPGTHTRELERLLHAAVQGTGAADSVA